MRDFPQQAIPAIEVVAELFARARHTVVLTGAGISTPSGIPDFRSEGTGLWSRDEPLEVASLETFRTHPERFFAWFRPLASQIFNARPNAAHDSLARLEQAGHVQAIVTQNIDMLHSKAGSRHVIEMHGTLRTLSCTACFRQYGYQDHLPPFINDGRLPYCPECGGLLKPDVVLFGEQLPQKAWQAAQRESRDCDLMVVAGSSLEVLPVAGLPLQAVDRGAHLIILNQTPTYLNVRADVVIEGNVVETLPVIAKRVLA